MSFSAGYIIQIHSFSFLFTSCIVDMFENKSKSVNICILLFHICPPGVTGITEITEIPTEITIEITEITMEITEITIKG